MIRAHYLGNGTEFHNGIPAKHLTDEEYAALTPEQQKLVKASALYKLEPVRPAKKETN